MKLVNRKQIFKIIGVLPASVTNLHLEHSQGLSTLEMLQMHSYITTELQCIRRGGIKVLKKSFH